MRLARIFACSKSRNWITTALLLISPPGRESSFVIERSDLGDFWTWNFFMLKRRGKDPINLFSNREQYDSKKYIYIYEIYRSRKIFLINYSLNLSTIFTKIPYVLLNIISFPAVSFTIRLFFPWKQKYSMLNKQFWRLKRISREIDQLVYVKARRDGERRDKSGGEGERERELFNDVFDRCLNREGIRNFDNRPFPRKCRCLPRDEIARQKDRFPSLLEIVAPLDIQPPRSADDSFFRCVQAFRASK